MVLCESLCMTGEDFFVSEIRPQDIEALRNNLITRGLKNTSVNRSLAVYKHFFNKCKQWGYVHTNPCQFIKKLPDNHKPRDSWLMEDLEVVSQHFKTHYYEDYLIFEFLRHTGCRLSTATRLRVRDVDLERKIVRLSTRKGAHSQERFYEVPISPRLGEVLKKCVKNKRLNDFVFLWRGQEVNCNNYSKRFKKRLRKLPLKGTCLILHALRNSFATRLSSKGVPINDIRRLLGHTNTIVTQMYLSENVEDLKKYVS